MSTSDLDAVALRRAEIARALEDLALKRANLAAEDDELGVTERVLVRIDRLLHAETTFPTNYVADEPMHVRAAGMFRTLMNRRGA